MLAAQNPSGEICWWTGGSTGQGNLCCSYYGDPLPHCEVITAPTNVYTKPVAPVQSLATPGGRGPQKANTICWTAPNGATCCHTEGDPTFGCAHIVSSGTQASKVPLRFAAQFGAPPKVRALARR
jgi:hypothetical protein